MSKYTTGEIAKLCGVSVRTVQYYDNRNILVPSELSEGGRRLYSEDDFKRLQIICFLRNIGIPINSISELLTNEKPEKVIAILLQQQEQVLRDELNERQKQLDMLNDLRRGLKAIENFSVESIGDIATTMENKKKMRKLHLILLLTGLPISVLQWGGIFLWIFTGQWWLFLVWGLIAIPYAICISKYYFDHTAYICPNCHHVFNPTFREVFFAHHTPTLRKLTCPSCGKKSFCVEIHKDTKA